MPINKHVIASFTKRQRVLVNGLSLIDSKNSFLEYFASDSLTLPVLSL